jgi:hypothetical protein
MFKVDFEVYRDSRNPSVQIRAVPSTNARVRAMVTPGSRNPSVQIRAVPRDMNCNPC